MSDHADAETPDTRRSKRLSLSLPIVIHGKDAQQNEFRESTHTLLVNPHGAKLLTSHQLVVGTEIVIENPTRWAVARANVVWVSSKRDPNGLQEVGVQLVTSGNIWGLEFPPGDWAPKEKDQEAVMEAAAPAPTPAESAPAKTTPPTLSSEEIATQILQELRETADAHARQFNQRLAQVVQQVGLELEVALRERADAQKKQELEAIEQQFLASSERLGALKAEMEELDARIAASHETVGAALESIPLPLTTEQIHEKIEAEALPVLNLITESGIGAARERFQAQAQADAGQALASWRSNLHVERDSILEETRQQIMMAVSSALEILQRERDAALTEMKRQIQEEIQANKERVVSQVKAELDVTAESHSASLMDRLNETVRETGERQANLLQNQLDALLVDRFTKAQQHAQLVGENLQASVEDGLRAVGEKSSRELQARLEEITHQTVASSSAQLSAQVEASFHAAEVKSLQAWQNRLQDIVSETIASSSDEIRAQVEASAHAAEQKSLQAWQTRLPDIVSTAAASSANQISAQVEASARAAEEKILQAWQTRLQDIVSTAVASSADQIRAQVDSAVQAMAGKALQVWQKRLPDIVNTAVASSFDQIRAQVDSSVQAISGKALQAWQAKLQEVAGHAAASSRDQVQAQVNEALGLLGPKLQEMQERAVDDALETFRGRFSQFLGLLQPGGNR